MLFRVLHTEEKDNIILVTGSTDCGTLKGIWKSSTLPAVGKTYNTELTFGLRTSAVDRADIVIGHSQTSAVISTTEDSTIFTGLCEEIDDIYYIRFSPDALEMLEIKNDDHTIKEGDYITFSLRSDDIGIYPY